MDWTISDSVSSSCEIDCDKIHRALVGTGIPGFHIEELYIEKVALWGAKNIVRGKAKFEVGCTDV